MVWADFVKIFREHHIPSSVMKLKRDEFRKLRQGGMNVTEYLHKFTELSRYAPEDINDDEKKQEAFLGGLNPEIRTLVEVTTHSDFNAMINRLSPLREIGSQNSPAPSIFSNSVQGPKQPAGTNRTAPARSQQQSFGKAKVNHVNVEEAEDAPGVIFESVCEYRKNKWHQKQSTCRMISDIKKYQ
ncbi:uncharacterized protein LOC112875977 [Panicum hallii]|uniref:uncharacterized protein LOC112875977 n=1 Tax=Panicum hallii TaxID=206008 RepID=UPI000DF4DF52|nr:uncharacterized protein LOC112875977 [Panicum hallii]